MSDRDLIEQFGAKLGGRVGYWRTALGGGTKSASLKAELGFTGRGVLSIGCVPGDPNQTVGHCYEVDSDYKHSRKGACLGTIQGALGRERKSSRPPSLVGLEYLGTGRNAHTLALRCPQAQSTPDTPPPM